MNPDSTTYLLCDLGKLTSLSISVLRTEIKITPSPLVTNRKIKCESARCITGSQSFFSFFYFFSLNCMLQVGASQVALVVKNLPINAGDIRDVGLIPGTGRSPGGHGNPLQYSCQENPTDRGVWQATVHRVTKSRTQLKWLLMHICICYKSGDLELCTGLIKNFPWPLVKAFVFF